MSRSPNPCTAQRPDRTPRAAPPSGPAGGVAPEPAQRVLIIRPTALGDVSRTVPVLVALRRSMPSAQIDWLVADTCQGVVRHHPDLNHVLIFPRDRFGRIWRSATAITEVLAWCRQLRRADYDLVFDLQGLFRSGLFTRVTGARRRVGFANARELGWLGYNRRHRVRDPMHAVDRMLALVEAEGVPPCHDTRLYVGQDDRRWLDDWLGHVGGVGTYACIAPTARWRCKCWPMEKYARITRQLLDSGVAGDRVVVLASPRERPQLQTLLERIGHDPRVVIPTTTVGQLMAILSRTSLLVSNDSAPLHIAVGFDRPIAAIFGPTNPDLVGPYRRGDCVVGAPGATQLRVKDYRRHRDDQGLIDRVSVEAVWDKILGQVHGSQTPGDS